MGVQQVLLGGGGSVTNSSITVGNSGNNYGYQGSGPAFGSVSSPLACPLFPSDTFTVAFTNTVAGFDFIVEVSGAVSQGSRFGTIQVEDHTGTIRTYTAASAAFVGGSPSSWTWGTGSNPVFNTVSQVRTFTAY